MSDKTPMAEGLRDAVVLIISGLGLSIEPHVFIACMLLSASGAVIGRGFSPVMSQRRAFILTLSSGVLFTIMVMLGDQIAKSSVEWWPSVPPQLMAIVSGLFGPLAIAYLMKRFPDIAERLLGKYLPEEPTSDA